MNARLSKLEDHGTEYRLQLAERKIDELEGKVEEMERTTGHLQAELRKVVALLLTSMLTSLTRVALASSEQRCSASQRVRVFLRSVYHRL